MRSSEPPAVQICSIFAAKFERRKAGTTFKSMFGRAESGVLLELGTEQVYQILKTALSIVIMPYFDVRVADMFCIVFRSKKLSLTCIIAECPV